MKHLAKFEGYETDSDNRIKLSDDDLNYIQKLLIDKMTENNIEITTNNIYSELELLKKDKKNSLIFYVIKDFLILNDYGQSVQNIMRTAIKFFDAKYGDIIQQFKSDRKTEFSINNDKSGSNLLLPFEDNIIKVPKKIGHNYIPIKILPLDELHTKYSRHKRLKVFHVKGLKCVNCPREGKYLIAAKDIGGAIHVDLYTKDFELMTIDHIKPKSKGGSYDIENLDPMCSFCNTKKSNKWDESINI